MDRDQLNWARSRWAGNISEFAVMSPIIPGRVPGERRTYEERLRFVLEGLGKRGETGVPTALSRIPTFHFARVMIIRPEHYLTNSALDLDGTYYDEGKAITDAGNSNIPRPLDQYVEFSPVRATQAREPEPEPQPKPDPAQNPNQFRSWLMTLVIFDGDPMKYLREIGEFIENDFDQVFQNCEDYPMARDFEPFWAWVRRYQIRPDVFYTPYPDLTVARIKQLQVFKDRFDAFVGQVRTPTGKKVENMDALFDQFLRDNQQFSSDFPTPGGMYRVKDS
jgi:hypothetical protein